MRAAHTLEYSASHRRAVSRKALPPISGEALVHFSVMTGTPLSTVGKGNLGTLA